MHPANKWLIGVVGAGLIASTSLWEGTSYKPYKDVTGTLTVCQGITEHIVPGKVYSPSECNALLTAELANKGRGVLQCVNVPLSANEYDAYTMFAYNVGTYNFCSSGIVRELNKGNHEEACKRIYRHPDGKPAWSYSKGIYLKGLQNRRKYESDICLGKRQHPTL